MGGDRQDRRPLFRPTIFSRTRFEPNARTVHRLANSNASVAANGAFDASRERANDLWHVVLFHAVGEVTRHELASASIQLSAVHLVRSIRKAALCPHAFSGTVCAR
jgi:hypothetical protein